MLSRVIHCQSASAGEHYHYRFASCGHSLHQLLLSLGELDVRAVASRKARNRDAHFLTFQIRIQPGEDHRHIAVLRGVDGFGE